MANYCATTRTNYFRVKDPEAFRKFMANVVAYEDSVEVWQKTNGDMEDVFGFGCYGSIVGMKNTEINEDDWEDYSYDDFVTGLSELVADDDAIIIIEIGNEKLRYLVGQATVITSTGVDFLDIQNLAAESAANLLKNPAWKTRIDY